MRYSLDAGAPSGASIDAVSGEFRWTPGEAEGPADYDVTVRVRDDGVPNLSDAEAVVITVGEVNEAPVMTAIADQGVDEGIRLIRSGGSGWRGR